MKKLIGRHYFVSGKVQGVWFRQSTKTEAERLGVYGWVRNLPDGRVELMAFGDEAVMDQLHEWLKSGPPLANVTDLILEEVIWQEMQDFKIT